MGIIKTELGIIFVSIDLISGEWISLNKFFLNESKSEI